MITLLKAFMALSSFVAIFNMAEKGKYALVFISIIVLVWSVQSFFHDLAEWLRVPFSYGYGNNYSGYGGYKSSSKASRPYVSYTNKDVVKDITKKMKPKNNAVIEGGKERTDRITVDKPTTVVQVHKPIQEQPLNLLPIKDILGKEAKKEWLKVIDADTKSKTVKVDEPIKIKDASVIIIDSESKLTKEKVLIYNAIIESLKGKHVSQSLTYTILQSIISIDFFSDAVMIYTSNNQLLSNNGLNIDDLTTSIRKALKNDKIGVEISKRKDVTISEYYLNNII